jgi:hypothetical protein
MCESSPFVMFFATLGFVIVGILACAVILIALGGPNLDSVFPDPDKKKGGKQ